jgi:hypothetical protein
MQRNEGEIRAAGELIMDNQAKAIGYIIIGLLVLVLATCLYVNHQVDTIKHSLGVKDGGWLETEHDEQIEAAERAAEEQAETGEEHTD